MKFLIRTVRSSAFETAKPLEQAVREQVTYTNWQGEKVMRDAWVIEVRTVSQLVKLAKEQQASVIVHAGTLATDLNEIEIYDTYRE